MTRSPRADPLSALTAEDRALVQVAVRTLRRRYRKDRHTVAAALRARSGRIYTGVCVTGLHSPCAEPIAMGTAIVEGDARFDTMVAVGRRGTHYFVISPCGSCRQLMYDYDPKAWFIVRYSDRRIGKLRASESLPAAYGTFEEPSV